MTYFTKTLATAAFILTAPMALAEGWTLDGGSSNLSFGSVKSEYTGESHSFKELTGTVSETGAVEVIVDLTSVETNIDIRNERMIEHVFKAAKTATINAQIDMDEVNGLNVGDSKLVEVTGTVEVVGTEVELDAEMFVMRLSEDKAMVATNGMVFLDMDEAGLNGGIDKLMELAGLESITRASPVTLRLMFNLGDKKV